MAKIEKHQLFKAFKSHQEVHIYPFPALSGTQLTAWARSHAQRIGLKIDDRLLQQVIAMVGSDVWQLSLELEKLAAYAGGQPVIEEMIRELVRANFEDQIFDFVDAVSNHQPKQALQLLAEQRLSGSTDQHLFAMLARQVRLLLGACDLLDQNPRTTKKDLADALGVHPFVAQKTLAQAGKMNASTLHHLHDMLFEFDQKMKGGGIAPDIAVDRLVAEMLA